MPPSILQTIADNPALFDEVKKVVLSKFTDDSDTRMSNELLGQKARARLEGVEKVESAFSDILAYRSNKEVKQKINKAR